MSTAVRALTNRHRAQQLLLGKATRDSIAKVWPLLDWAHLDDSYPEFARFVQQLIRRNRQDSAALASMYLKQARRAAGLSDEQKVILAAEFIVEQFEASLQATSIAALKTSAANGVDPLVASGNALTMTGGSMSRLVLLGGRQTITQTTTADPGIVGWQRVGVGKCDFCQMLLGRGAVYSEASADFEAHDSCGCSAEPVYH